MDFTSFHGGGGGGVTAEETKREVAQKNKIKYRDRLNETLRQHVPQLNMQQRLERELKNREEESL